MRRATMLIAVVSMGCSAIVPGPDDFTYDLNDDAGRPRDGGPEPDAGATPDSGPEPDAGADAGPSCGAGEMFCGGGCVDTQTSVEHCGGCGNSCDDGWSCFDGGCFDPVVSVSVGFYHSCGRTQSRRVFCWGSNESGQLGNGSFVRSLEPVEVDIDDVVALDSYGRFFTSFMGYSCAVRGSGELHCWGMNYAGQLGDGGTEPRNRPAAVPGLMMISEVATSNEFACAVRSAGSIACWGRWLAEAHESPEMLPGVTSNAVSVDAGLGHACAVHVSGAVTCWGNNSSGQLGDDTRPEQWAAGPVPGVSGAIAVAAGSAHACALLSSGQVYCWGAANALGIGATTDESTPPTEVSGLADVTAIAAGLSTTCAIHGTERLLSCWAPAGFESSSTPRQVAGLTNVASVAVGSSHACAALGNGSVYCWGSNQHGQLGDGTTDDHAAPAAVLGLP